MNRRERDRLLAAAEDYFRCGNAALARLALESLLASGASSSKAFKLLGYVHGNEGDLAGAHRRVAEACRLPGPSPEAWCDLGVSHLKRHEAEPAIDPVEAGEKACGPFEMLAFSDDDGRWWRGWSTPQT